MAILGERPETGVRIAIERDKHADDGPWTYAGTATLPAARHPVRVSVSEAGEVTVSLDGAEETGAPPPPDLAERVRLIVRTVYRQAKADGEAPAWRIVRWRARD
ncbi:MAG: hypothetical protein JWP97_2323 [Labilithrix sp.]|nr:hypothetical protein [Labilithrix sp.]